MTATSDRFRKVAAGFTARARAVPPGGWEAPAPCEGWVARDIVRHLVEWVPAFLAGGGVSLAPGPDVDEDPAGAWQALGDGLQAVLDDPGVARRVLEHERIGRVPLDEAIDRFVLGDVLVHTWDLARAVGSDERLDPDEVRRMLEGVEPVAPTLAASGHYGPVADAPPDADDQTRLLALLGRRVSPVEAPPR